MVCHGVLHSQHYVTTEINWQTFTCALKQNKKSLQPLSAGAEDDGGEQPEGHPAAADRGQDHPAL